MLPETITIKIDYEPRVVSTEDYVRLVTVSLQESYPSTTEENVREQLELLLAREGWTTVIGAFIEGDLVLEE